MRLLRRTLALTTVFALGATACGSDDSSGGTPDATSEVDTGTGGGDASPDSSGGSDTGGSDTGGGRDATGQDATGQDATGQDATGQDATGQDATGQDAIDPDSGLNACGGEGELAASPGDPCGTCEGGQWACDGTSLVCQGAVSQNACGGCGTLSGRPGDTCASEAGAGTLICDGAESVRCAIGASNACGGQSTLTFEGAPAAPGDACTATCGSGNLQCNGSDALQCVGSVAENACGGCAPLANEANTLCGECNSGLWSCETPDTLSCWGDTLDACGGCSGNTGTPGTTCNFCRAWTCDDTTILCPAAAPAGCFPAVASEGAYPRFVRVEWTLPAEHPATSYEIYRDGQRMASGSYLGGSPTTTTYDDIFAPGFPLVAVESAAASTDRPDGVALSWSVPPLGDAPRSNYTVRLYQYSAWAESEPVIGWFANPEVSFRIRYGTEMVTTTETGWVDETMPPASFTAPTATASTTSYAAVELRAGDPAVTPGASRTYRISRVANDGEGAAVTVTGNRGVGTFTWQWERATAIDGAYAAIRGATTPSFDDSSAQPGVTYFYRAQISASGVEGAQYTAPIQGLRRATCEQLACDESGKRCVETATETRCECAAGTGDCDNDASNGCEAATNTAENCGGCGIACTFGNAAGICDNGQCVMGTCNNTWADCDNNPANGCESYLRSRLTCGSCTFACAPNQRCGTTPDGRYACFR